MNPGDRPRRALLTTIGAAVAIAAATTIAVATDTEPAGAGELERFASCEALAQWGADTAGGMVQADGGALTDDADTATAAPGDASGSMGAGREGAESGQGTGGDVATDGAAPPIERSPASTTAELPRTDDAASEELAGRTGDPVDDGTNVIVEGVDELDVIDLLDRDHALVSAARRLSIVDLVDDQVVANLPVPSSVQITYDRENGIAWVVGPDDSGRLTATRIAVTPTSLTEDATWSTDGWLVDARRIGGRLHLVAADGYDLGVADVAREAAPFTDGPVPCDQVLHPSHPSDPTATLLVTLPATGPLEPEHATEVVGSGQLVHVTTEAAYLATPLYGNTVETSIHRFDLETLSLTGSGRVAGTLLNQFAMSDHDGHLRVATTDPRGGFGMPIEGDAMVPEIATTGGGPRTTLAVAPEPDAALNEVVVLDTDGSLDEVGRTPRFGHPRETLHGIRFDGAIAYAVTFLQTDPFYVIDLADPTNPTITGEVELPGFSSYLHPVGDGLVAGFGPDETGKVAVKLFDVSDRSKPQVVDQLDLGDESPIAWDHHAFVDLGDGRFAVPATTYRQLRPAGCTPARQAALQAEVASFEQEMGRLYQQPEMDAAASARANELMERQAEIAREGCLYPNAVPESSVVVVDTAGGRLQLVQRLGAVRTATSASRAVPTDDGWALLAGNRWVVLDGSNGDPVADLELGPEEPAYPVDVGGGSAGRPGLVIE